MGVPEHFSKYWCEQASSAAQVCKEINEAKRSAIYLQNEQGMDDAQRAEKRGLGGKSSKQSEERWPEASKEQEQMLVSRSWFSERGFPNGFPKYGFSIIVWFHYIVSQSSYGSIIWFLNHHMVSQNMVSQSKNGIPKYGFSIKIW